MTITFNEADLMRKYTIRPYHGGEHEVGRKVHLTSMYKFELEPNLVAYWSICPDCKVVRTKKLIEYVNKDEQGYATAYVTDLIKNGEPV